MPFVAVGCWARAHAGEVFYHIPNRGMRTYGETFSALLGRPARATRTAIILAKQRPANASILSQAPLRTSALGTLVGVKFALDLLNLESEAPIPPLF